MTEEVGRQSLADIAERQERFLAVKYHVVDKDLETAYREMARDKARESEALEWSEGLNGDIDDESR